MTQRPTELWLVVGGPLHGQWLPARKDGYAVVGLPGMSLSETTCKSRILTHEVKEVRYGNQSWFYWWFVKEGRDD